ncbi:uncharacterized protein K02A2.6 [Aplysia californica]|uniref:Uncharacterized protein K02A2.6 n=1 Tax=Aplysia californica TaxID=6500 RepID=A0ABM1W3J2_APLCA|nr:uncharacterized protein K02A2.6 [Aplysia californica]
MDLFEWKGHDYLLIVDYFSRWIEIVLLRKTTSSTVVEHSKSIFAKYGIPEIVISDNGPQFASCEFANFAETYGFEHKTSSPKHPQGNGEAERAVQTVKNLLRKADDPHIAILNYRATPLKQGQSPAELLQGRQLRTKLPSLPSQLKPQGRKLKQFRSVDKHMKNQQKNYFDRRHGGKRLQNFERNETVWITEPKLEKASILKPYQSRGGDVHERSYLVDTPRGMKRRNRSHLRRRSLGPCDERKSTHVATSLISTPRDRLSQTDDRHPPDNAVIGTKSGGNGNNKSSSLPVTAPRCASPPMQHTHSEQTQTHYTTRSGREIKPPQKLTL